MYERKIPKKYNCGMEVTLEVIGGKWKPRIIYLLSKGPKRPSELQKDMSEASRRVLNVQLKEMEDHGIISKKIFPVLPPKVEYSLTGFGECLLPVIRAMEKWGAEYRKTFQSLMEKKTRKQASQKVKAA